MVAYQKSWRQSQEAAVSIEHAHPWPRDLRGMLRMDGANSKRFFPESSVAEAFSHR